MALDERRRSFNLTRPVTDSMNTTLVENWFRGVHSDVGGGNGNTGRNCISLAWMLEHAIAAGVPIDDGALSSAQLYCDATSAISANTDPDLDDLTPERTPHDGDIYHASAQVKKLDLGESHMFAVAAASKMNPAGLSVKAGESYAFSVPDDQTWTDKTIECGPDGWTNDSVGSRVGKYFRRVRSANWFELIGVVGANDRDENRVRIGDRKSPLEMPESGELYCYANDIEQLFYRNNKGVLTVTVKRTS